MGEDAVAAHISEFVGTWMLVFTIGCNVLTGQAVWGGISIACVLMVMIYSLGKSSGANFNPAVSVALSLAGKQDWPTTATYSVTQIIAGIVAGGCYRTMFGEAFNLGPVKPHTVWQAGLAELLYTFMLCFVVLNVAASKFHGGRNQFFGIAIGFVIVAGAYSGGSISMGCFNPAVAFGIDVSSADKGVYYCFVYTVFELIGAAIAAFAFKYVRGDQEAVADDETTQTNTQVGLGPKLVSEFIGTYILVLTVGLNVLSASAAGAFSIAASLMCMIFALGSVSGAHFNPAVTTAIMLRDPDTPKSEYGLYMVSQIVGGIAAAFTYAALNAGATFKLNPGTYNWTQVVVAEFVFTFVLAYVVLTVIASVKKEDQLTEYFAFAIGMCVTVGGCAIGKVSGGSLNPAVSIGISSSHIMGGGVGWPCLVYSLVEVAAGAAAAGMFTVTHPSQIKAKTPTAN